MKYLLSFIFFFNLYNTYSQNLPDFNLKDLNGNVLTKDDLKGKNVYINVFESWCGSCITEIPILNETQANLKDVVFIAITPASRKKAEHFQRKHGFNFSILPEADELCKQLNVKKFPTHFVVDKNGDFKEIDFNVSVQWLRKDYKNGKPPKKIFDQLVFEQNKSKLENEIKLHLISE
jgi:peroxiredoxin